MTVDTRCTIICDQGRSLSGSLSEDHIDTANVLAKVRGSIVLDGIKNLARGGVINVAYQVPGYNEITRFSRRLRVLSCKVDPYDEVTNLEVGCVLTLRQDLNPGENYRADAYAPAWYQAIPDSIKDQMPVPIYASGVLSYCLTQLGLTAAAGNTPLVAAQLRSDLDLGQGYVQVINELLLSESCYGFINAAEEFVVRPIIPDAVTGPVLTRNELLTLEGIEGGSEPADVIEVVWNGGLEVPEDLELADAPLVPELPANAGGALNFTPEQAEDVNGFISLIAKKTDISEREARGALNRGVLAVGPEPVDGVISFTSTALASVKQSAAAYASEYSGRRQKAREYQRRQWDDPPPPEDPAEDDQGPPPRQPRPMRDWTYDVSYSTPRTYQISYVVSVGGADVEVRESVEHGSKSETTTTYGPFYYYDSQGNQQQEDVVVTRETETTSVVGAINQTRWKSKREKGSPARAEDIVSYKSVTTYEYVATADGPRVVKEETKEYEPRIGFAGGLGIQNWFGVDLGLDSVLRSQTETIYDWDDRADRTKTIVKRWLAIGATSEGATAAAAMAKDLNDIFGEDAPHLYPLAIEKLVTAASELVFDGAETRLSIGRGNVESRPSPQERAREELQRDPVTGRPRTESSGWPGLGGVTKGTSNGGPSGVLLAFGGVGGQANKNDTFTLPFPADDVLSAEIDGDELFNDWLVRLQVTPGKIQEQALRFARAMAYLSYGHAAGVSITTEIRNLPSEPFAPIYIDAAGVSAVFRCNGMSWGWSGDGLIVGADALLHGAAGSVGQVEFSDAWVPVPVAIAGLPVAPTASSNANPKPANTITTPNGFDPLNPTGLWSLLPTNGSDVPAVQRTVTAVVEPRNETLPVLAKTRSKASLIAFDYALTATTETLQVKTRTKVRQVSEVAPPTTELAIAPQAPAVAVNVPVPAAGLAIAGVAPAVTVEVLAVVVAPPVTSLAIEGVPPVVEQIGVNALLPVVTLTAEPVAPVVDTYNPNEVLLPFVGLDIIGVAPTVAQADPHWSSVSLLLSFDGTNGSTTITDDSSNANTISVFGTAAITTADKQYGTGSLNINNSAGAYVQTPASALFQFGTGNFTVEFWANPASNQGNQGLFTFGGTATGLFLAIFNGNWMLGTAGSGGTNMGAAATGWQHVAITRSGTSLRLFIGGVQKGSTLTNSTNLSDNQLKIGYYYNTSYPFNGKQDEFRVTKGVARYTAGFTAPGAAFPRG